MKLPSQKRIAATVLKRSPKRVKLDPSRLEEIKESITKTDIRHLVRTGAIKGIQKKGVSRARAKKTAIQKRKGRQKGQGSRKGTANARLKTKHVWMARLRKQRLFLRVLLTNKIINRAQYQDLYYKSKGGFFRSKRHLKLYVTETVLKK